MLSIEQLQERADRIENLNEVLKLAPNISQSYVETALRDLLAIVWETARDVNPRILEQAGSVIQPSERVWRES